MSLHIVLHCGGMPFNGDIIKSASLGGSETAAYYLARELAKEHRVTLFTNSNEEGVFDEVRYCWAGNVTEASPLGDRFEWYATNTPHDVLIIQRHPKAFVRPYAAKLTYLWLHDLALHRSKGAMQAQMWNVTRTLCVSEYHKKQVCDVYDFSPRNVRVLPNGVDLELYARDIEPFADGKKHLIYSSRPERGLENLVKPDGIMERLGDKYQLHVCGYSNTTEQMRPYYEQLYARIEQLPNCVNEGSLTKEQLAELQIRCDAWVYPTEFEEVFCITAAECMAAGTQIITSRHGCLPETLGGTPARLLSQKEGHVDVEAFVEAIRGMEQDTAKLKQAAKKWSVQNAAAQMTRIIEQDFDRTSTSTLAQHLMHTSDIVALDKLRRNNDIGDVEAELEECYKFYLNDDFIEHYRRYYDYEKSRGVDYGPENLDGNSRFEAVAARLADLPADSTVLDYGCAHGHYTVNLARRFPQLRFTGIDLVQRNINTAKAWAEEAGCGNVEFRRTDGSLDPLEGKYDLIIAAEVVEHVADPQRLVDWLAEALKPDGTMLITTPYGPWEAHGYKQHWPWRAHLHHFERADLHDMFGQHPEFSVLAIPNGGGLGSYMTTYRKPSEMSGPINYDRKFRTQAPQQTVSACMIVKDGAATILQALDSIKDVIDELVMGIDDTTRDDTRDMVLNFCNEQHIPLKMFDIPSPIETGFDSARNLTLKYAGSDWILWIDADEVLHHPKNLLKYLRMNQWKGYGLKQHHMAVEPLGNIKTDYPCRLFRNHRGVRFYGIVHEHPEVKMNEGLGSVQVIGDVDIMHTGYATEDIRRRRFERNIELMTRDREKYPERILGKFLWMRDLSLMCQYTYEQTGTITEQMLGWAQECIKLWEELVKDKHYRLVLDGLEFYSRACRVLGGGFDFAVAIDASKLNGGADLRKGRTVEAHFANRGHVDMIVHALMDEKLSDYESRYF